jgi:hypothetical protein
MADELDDLNVSFGTQILVYDLAIGCMVSRTGHGVPSIVMPRPGGQRPKTRGQVDDAVIEELLVHGLVHLFGETSPQQCRLTLMGKAYYERVLKRTSPK